MIGAPFVNAELHYRTTDSKTGHLNNSKTMPGSWEYNHKPITYKYNKFGHRCKNIEDIDLDNYILFAGCSYTEGVGLALSDTYPDIVSRKLGCDYYNMGLGGIGIDVLTFNIVSFLSKVKKQPKAIVVQWPTAERFAVMLNDEVVNLCGTWSVGNTLGPEGEFIVSGQELNFFSSRKFLSKTLLRTLCHQFISNELITKEEDSDFVLNQLDAARDLAHAGSQSHLQLANDIISIFD